MSAAVSDDTRIDRWLCAVRLVKTRPMATQLCDGGHVRVNGNPAKPSTKVRAGDVVHALIAERERIVEVVRPIETRVGAPVAATCYIDNSPPPVDPRDRARHQGGPRRGPAEQAASPRARTDAAGWPALSGRAEITWQADEPPGSRRPTRWRGTLRRAARHPGPANPTGCRRAADRRSRRRQRQPSGRRQRRRLVAGRDRHRSRRSTGTPGLTRIRRWRWPRWRSSTRERGPRP